MSKTVNCVAALHQNHEVGKTKTRKVRQRKAKWYKEVKEEEVEEEVQSFKLAL